MSHASARIVFADGLVLWGEYNGTVDLMLPKLFSSLDDLEANWRTQERMQRKDWDCECGAREPCVVLCSYGDCWWLGMACRIHHTYCSPHSGFYGEVQVTDGDLLLDECRELLRDRCRACGCLKSQHNYSDFGGFYECQGQGHQPQTGKKLVWNCPCRGYVPAVS